MSSGGCRVAGDGCFWVLVAEEEKASPVPSQDCWQEQRALHQTLGYLQLGIEGWELKAGPWRQLAAPAHAALCSESVLQEQTGAQGDVLASPWVCQVRVALKLLAARPCPLSCGCLCKPKRHGA